MRQKAERFIKKLTEKKRVHFLHIGKTGGTAVKCAIRQHGDESRRYIIELHPHPVTLCDIPEGERVFFFLRDPISRFVSGFYSRQRRGQPRYFSEWKAEEKIAFEYFDTPNHLAIALSSPNVEERERAKAAMENIEHVRDSYWKWFINEDYFRSRQSDILFVGFQERLTDDFETLKAKLGLPKDLTLPNDDIQAHRNPANLNTVLDEQAVVNLKTWYEKDFRFIELCQKMTSK